MEPDLDILQELDLITLTKLMIICKEHLPKSIRAHHFLYNYIRWENEYTSRGTLQEKVLSDKCRVKFYGPRTGNMNNCTFFAISGEKDYSIFFYTLEESCKELHECLRNTRRIKWELKPLLVAVELQHHTDLYRVFLINCLYYVSCYMFYLPKEKAISFEIVAPPDCYLSSIREEDAHTINEVWPQKYEGSVDFVRTLIYTNGGIGLYSRHNKQLLSWALIFGNFCPGILQTVTHSQRKGYAEIVAKAMARLIGEKFNLDVLIFVVKVNKAAINLYTKLGFEKINSCTCMKVEEAMKLP